MHTPTSLCSAGRRGLEASCPPMRRGRRREASRRSGSGWLMSAAAIAVGILAGRTGAEPIRNPDNGHYYEAIVRQEGVTWVAARRGAAQRVYAGRSGHLATITSPEENRFVTTHFRPATQFGYWLGGFQLPGILDPAAGWQWVTGEPFSYTNWLSFDFLEPDDAYGPGTSSDDESALQFWPSRSEEHTSELQSRLHLVCRLLLEKKKVPGDIGLLTVAMLMMNTL